MSSSEALDPSLQSNKAAICKHVDCSRETITNKFSFNGDLTDLGLGKSSHTSISSIHIKQPDPMCCIHIHRSGTPPPDDKCCYHRCRPNWTREQRARNYGE